jgi:hypothetical protein
VNRYSNHNRLNSIEPLLRHYENYIAFHNGIVQYNATMGVRREPLSSGEEWLLYLPIFHDTGAIGNF